MVEGNPDNDLTSDHAERPTATRVPGDAEETSDYGLPSQVGRYRIIKRLGAGGMGAVYAAEDVQLGRMVALKLPRIDDNGGNRPKAVQRFLREARSAARVRHPGVCAVYDVGEHNGAPYVVMALIEGQSLSHRIREHGKFADPREAANLALQVARALAAVHAEGIVHRDLKPGNILLDKSGQAYLADFGLARPTEDGEHLTIEGGVIGTPAYMAPEQANGEAAKIGPRTDVYGLGVVLYQLLAGRLPFEGTGLAVIARVLVEEPAPLAHHRADIDARLAAIVKKAMARQPEDRFADAAAFATALEDWLAGAAAPVIQAQKPISHAASARRRRRWLAAAVVALLAAMTAPWLVKFIGRDDVGSGPPLPVSFKQGESRFVLSLEPRAAAGKPVSEIPFVVGVLADLSGHPLEANRKLDERRFVHIHRQNFDEVMRAITPRLTLTGADGTPIKLTFRRMADFGPPDLYRQIPEVESLLEQRARLGDRRDPEGLALAAKTDTNLSDRISRVMHHPDFQKLEATWRGLFYLVNCSDSGDHLRIRVLNVSKAELQKDLDRAAEFDQSTLFKKTYTEEYDQLGGQPFGLFIADYYFNCHAEDVGMLQKLAWIAATCHAPLVAGARSEAFGMDSFEELTKPRDIAKIFAGPDYSHWHALRAAPESRYLALTCPRVLGRLPYGQETIPVAEFRFEEREDGQRHDKYLWMNGAWAYATCVTSAYMKTGWLAATCGVTGGGRVEMLPVHVFPSEDGDQTAKCPTEVAISDRREDEMSRLGFLPLLHAKGHDFAVFRQSRSIHLCEPQEIEAGARLNVLLCANRFFQGLHLLVRDQIGTRREAAEYERLMNEWINNYVLDNPKGATADLRATRPLQEAVVEVREIPGRQGYYKLTLRLRPHYQFDERVPPLEFTTVIRGRG